MIRRLLACTALLLSAVSPAAAQMLRVDDGVAPRTVSGIQRGGVYYRADAIELMGGTVARSADIVTIVLGRDSIRMRTGSPFFAVKGRAFQMAFPILAVDRDVLIPEQFFLQWMPNAYPDRYAFRDGTLRVTGVDAAPAATPAPPAVTESPPARRTQTDPDAHPRRIVVIDPGHGGVDSGATGPDSLQEKTICLQLAKRLAAVLRQRGYEVHLTRTTDTLISLADRPRFANQWKGDEPGALYISIHNNSLKTAPGARGFETYFLADASTSDERRVADMENAAVKFETESHATSSGLDQVLNGLRNDFYMRTSNSFADVVQKGLSQFHPGPNRGVKRANFRVLIGALMPAVLVEVGFISNPTEGRLLGTAAFQDKIAYSLAQSVDRFFRDNEPLWLRQ